MPSLTLLNPWDFEREKLTSSERAEKRLAYRLKPERGRPAGGRHAGWLRIDPAPLALRGRWVRLRYSASYFDDPIRPVIRFATPKDHYDQVMNGPVLGSGEWIGRIPKDVVAVSIDPGTDRGRFRIDSIDTVSRTALVRRGLVYDRHSLAQSLGAKIINAKEERWDMLRFAGTATPLDDYDAWHRRLVRAFDPGGLDRSDRRWEEAPAIHLMMRLEGSVDALRRTLASLRAQFHAHWLLHARATAATPAALADFYGREAQADKRLRGIGTSPVSPSIGDMVAKDLLAVIETGDLLPDHALAVVAEAAHTAPAARVLYGDEDAVAPDGTLHSPLFKPDWSPAFFRATRYLGRLVCLRVADVARRGIDGAETLLARESDILADILAVVSPAEVRHIRRILYRRARVAAVDSAGAKPGTAVGVSGPRLSADAPLPRVAIIIPTRDRADLLARCVDSLQATDYPHLGVVLVDNGTTSPEALALLRRYRSRAGYTVIERPGAFNFSALCNDGAAASTGELLVFLNNDVVAFDSQWLRRMVAWAVQPQIGIVGAKLLFPDNRLEHGGVVIGHGGIAGHIDIREPGDAAGYMRQLAVSHEVSAVTGACIAVRRAKFEVLGGFDADNLPVDLNDIDLCLKAREHGWRNIWCADAVLYHEQSATRGYPAKPATVYRKERSYFRRRWAHVIRDDPFFHPALSLYSHRVALA